MRRTAQLVVLLSLAVLATGCATPYMTNRGRDAKDIVTGMIGWGGGAKARIGPANVGLFAAFDLSGLRGGHCGPVSHDFAPYDLTLTLCSLERFDSYLLEDAKARHKTFFSQGYLGLTVAGLGMEAYRKVGDAYHPKKVERLDFLPTDLIGQEILPYYTQVEIAMGVWRTLRLGFNPGELLDFVLGWTGIDIFNDDVEKWESNQPME